MQKEQRETRGGYQNEGLDGIEDKDEYWEERGRQGKEGEKDARSRFRSGENTINNTTLPRSLSEINAEWNEMPSADNGLSSQDLATNLVGHNIAEDGYRPKRVSTARVVNDGGIRLYHEGGGLQNYLEKKLKVLLTG